MASTLIEALKKYDLHLLQIIANRWDADVDQKDAKKATKQLAKVMLDGEKAAVEWERLQDDERGALQMLIATPTKRMPKAQFERLYGDIRQMGPEKRQREKPHLKPNGKAEVLFYRGFVHLAFDEGKAGVQPFVYVPDDLAATLPTHQAGYDLSKPDPGEDLPPLPDDELAEAMLSELVLEEDPPHLHRADTSIIDDITTLLAYVQTHTVLLDQGYVPDDVQQDIISNFIGQTSEKRTAFILYLLVEMQLLADVNGQLQTQRDQVKSWLDAPRTSQMRQLVMAWHDSTAYNELWHVPGLMPEPAGWQNDPRFLRNTLKETIQFLGAEGWVSIAGLVQELKESEPDFQRPGGDYDSWYIRDAASGDYLRGFESWDRVEGVTLSFTITGPMFWLALVDLGAENAKKRSNETIAFRLTAFGRAWAGGTKWPDVRDPDGIVTIHPDGRIETARAISRYDRFQLARFTTWEAANDPYIYRLTGDSLRRAGEQGISTQHIQAFLQRVTEQPLPKSVITMLSSTRADGDAAAVLDQMVVLQVDSPEMMKSILEVGETRRYLGKLLGPTAVAVRANQWQGLLEELQKRGILVDNLMT